MPTYATPEAAGQAYRSGTITKADFQRELDAFGFSYLEVQDYLSEYAPFVPPDDTVYVPPIGPPVIPGDFDGDGIPNEQDPDHYLPDLDNDGQADIFDVRDVGNGGIESGGRARLLNVAGYWTLGVAQGTLFMLVPMVMVGLSVGFMQRVVKLGAKVGGE